MLAKVGFHLLFEEAFAYGFASYCALVLPFFYWFYAEAAPPDGLERCVVKTKGLPLNMTKAELRAIVSAYDLAPVLPLERFPEGVSLRASIAGVGINTHLTDNVYWGVKADGTLSGGLISRYSDGRFLM